MIIIVTGGAGFIGSNLCHRLIDEGNKVICIDNFFTGNKDNIRDIINHNNFLCIDHDVIYPIEIKGEINQIYHLACPASPPKYQIDPIYTAKINFFRNAQHVGVGKKEKCNYFANINVRSLRRT